MTQERNQPGQSDGYPSSTQVPGTTNPEPIREPWDPRSEPQGAPMPWEEPDKGTPTEPDMRPRSGPDDSPGKKR